MSDDIVERLRAKPTYENAREAADEITRLREDLRCARAALTDWHEAHDKVRADRDRLREAYEAARDAILNGRGALESPCLDSDQTNAVLSELDDAFSAALAGERKADHQHTNECWEPDSGCDMGRNEKHVVTGDRQSVAQESPHAGE